MRRLLLLLGFALGYYLGAKAGRERYVQMNRMLRKMSRSDLVETATSRARSLVEVSRGRARDLVEAKAGDGQVSPSASP